MSSGADDDDPLQESKAYGSSIYVMVAVPYLMLGAVGFMVYRGLRQPKHGLGPSLDDKTSDDPQPQ